MKVSLGTRCRRKRMDSFSLFNSLLRAENEDEVEVVLRDAGFLEHDSDYWMPLGQFENNFSTVGNQQTEASAALVEKIINGIDAVLMSECFKMGVHPESPDAPTSMTEAVQRFFRDANKMTNLAGVFHVVKVYHSEEI